jgi:putative iron-regulated protein
MLADLEEMVGNWRAGGAARVYLDGLAEDERLAVILTGLGSLSYGELAGERMKLGLILRDPEEEHDCFSDNTHNSHYHDVAGMWSIYSGTLKRRDGSTLEGPGIQDLAAAQAPEAQQKLDGLMEAALASFKAIKDKADSGAMAYDQMIGAGNQEGNALVQSAIDSLVAQTRGIEALVTAMKLTIKVEGSDSLDNPGAVTQQ